MNLVLCPFQRAGIGRRAFDVKRSSIVTSLLILFTWGIEWLSRFACSHIFILEPGRDELACAIYVNNSN